MRRQGLRWSAVGALSASLIAIAVPGASAAAGLFGGGPKVTAAAKSDNAAAAPVIAQVREALDERRYADAATMLEQAVGLGIKSPEITVLSGDLMLARSRYEDALAAFKAAETDPAAKGEALEGEGIAQSILGRSDDAFTALQQATTLEPSLWHAWNALGAEYDRRKDWSAAEDAYDKALAAPHADKAVVLNNRGYSYLLQRRNTEAAADFVAALEKNPTLASARTNLRLTLAAEGQYDRAAAVGAAEDRAAVLNNVGLVAAMRGDYGRAEDLLKQAIAAKGEYYGRASANLQLSQALATRTEHGAGDAAAH